MAGTATITGVIGPGKAVTATVFSNVSWFAIDTDKEILDIRWVNGGRVVQQQVEIVSATTITCTVSGNTYTLTIS